MKLQVKDINQKTRLDAYIVRSLKKPRNYVDKLFARHLVLLNGQVASKKGWWIQNGDTIIINDESNKRPTSLIKSSLKVKIVYEDDNILVIDKPKHMLVHPTSFNEQDTLVNVLLNKIDVKQFTDNLRPGVIHRLDRDTSGLVLFAKNKNAYDSLVKQLTNRDLIRKYLALVHYPFVDKYLLIKAPIGRSKQNELKMVVTDDTKAKLAQTEVTVLENYHNAACVECKLLTGRTHQIRVHMSYIHHPIFNDQLYGKNDGYKDYGQFLHAHFLSFMHPITNKTMTFESKPDKTFLSLQKQLKGGK